MGEFTAEYPPPGSPPPSSNATAPAPAVEQDMFLARETWLSLWVLGDPYNCLVSRGHRALPVPGCISHGGGAGRRIAVWFQLMAWLDLVVSACMH